MDVSIKSKKHVGDGFFRPQTPWKMTGRVAMGQEGAYYLMYDGT